MLQLTDEERTTREFTCPICKEKTTISNTEANLRNFTSYLSESDVFSTTHQTNTIQVVFQSQQQIIVLYNNEIIAQKSITNSPFGNFYELEFKAKEHGNDVPYRVTIDIYRGQAYSLHCTIYRKKKRIYHSESKSSKVVGYIALFFFVISMLLYLLSK
jgi:hypothetical protein